MERTRRCVFHFAGHGVVFYGSYLLRLCLHFLFYSEGLVSSAGSTMRSIELVNNEGRARYHSLAFR